MVEKKVKSNRMSLHKKYKIESKVRSHYRKIRRAAKQNKQYVARKQAKDPGIPNSWPFKQEMLEEAFANKVKMENIQKEQKNARRKEQDKRRKTEVVVGEERKADKATRKNLALDIASLAKDASKRSKDHTAKTQEDKDIEALATGFNGIPGTTMQAYYREFRKVVEAADVILEVLDARDPLGCRCPDVERMIVTNYPGKKIVLVLNKVDLAPREVVENWLKYLRNEYPTVAFKSSRQNQRKLGQSDVPVALASNEALQGSSCLGADTLLQLLKHYAKTGNIKTSVTVGIVGFPNVGKSSVINSLCRTRAVKVGATPGVTRAAQEVHLDKHVKLLDSPGIVFPKSTDGGDDIILRHCVQIEKIPDPISPIETIVRKCNKEVLLRTYCVPSFSDAHEFLRHVAKAQGKVGKGGVADVNAAARKVIQDWVSGKIPFYTEAPALDKGIHVGAEVVSAWGKEFDLSQDDDNILATLDARATYDGQALEASTSMTEAAPLFLYNKPASSSRASVRKMPVAVDEVMEEDEDDLDIDDSDLDEEEENMSDDNAKKVKEAPKPTKQAQEPLSAAKKKKAAIVRTKQDLTDEADQFNPQVNKNNRKQQKQAKKKAKKVIPSKNDKDAYTFAEFGEDTANDDDIDINDVDDE